MNERTAFIMMASNVYGGSRAASLPIGEISKLSDASVDRPEIGFKAEAYRIEQTGQIVVAIAGTNVFNLSSLSNAVGIGFQILPEAQMAAAESFVRDVTTRYGDSVTLIGHSSGGLIAQLVAAKQEAEPPEDRLAIDRAIGFNSPGAAPFLPALFGDNIPASFENIEAVCDSRDIVCRAFDIRDGSGLGNSHIGSVEYINTAQNSEPLFGMSLTNPYNAGEIVADIVRFHGILHLLRVHAESLPDPLPVEGVDEISGPFGLGIITLEAVEVVGEPSPLEEGAAEFNTFQTSSPLVLDLDGDGIETRGLLAGAFFDHAGDGFAELTGWIGADDGLLILDRNGNGTVDHGAELFGNETRLTDGTKAGDGYEALAQFDENGDGQVDASDPVWNQLRVWRDADGNGDSEASELHALADVGVAAIGTTATSSTLMDANGNEHRLVGDFTRSDAARERRPTCGFAWRAGMAWRRTSSPCPTTSRRFRTSRARDRPRTPSGHRARRHGRLASSFSSSSESRSLAAHCSAGDILFRWTGSDGATPTAAVRTSTPGDGHGLERVYGDAFVGIEGTGNPNAEVGGLLDHTYQGLANRLRTAHGPVASHRAVVGAFRLGRVGRDGPGRPDGVIGELRNCSRRTQKPAEWPWASSPGPSGGSAWRRWSTTRRSATGSPSWARTRLDRGSGGKIALRGQPATTVSPGSNGGGAPGRKRQRYPRRATRATTSSMEARHRYAHRRRERGRVGRRERRRYLDGRRGNDRLLGGGTRHPVGRRGGRRARRWRRQRRPGRR